VTVKPLRGARGGACRNLKGSKLGDACSKLMLTMWIFMRHAVFFVSTRHAEFFAVFGNQLLTPNSTINPAFMETIQSCIF
jgi:hypothetical protein